MKTFSLLLTSGLWLLTFVFGSAADLKLNDGRNYKDASVVRVATDGVTIKHEGSLTKILRRNLSSETIALLYPESEKKAVEISPETDRDAVYASMIRAKVWRWERSEKTTWGFFCGFKNDGDTDIKLVVLPKDKSEKYSEIPMSIEVVPEVQTTFEKFLRWDEEAKNKGLIVDREIECFGNASFRFVHEEGFSTLKTPYGNYYSEDAKRFVILLKQYRDVVAELKAQVEAAKRVTELK